MVNDIGDKRKGTNRGRLPGMVDRRMILAQVRIRNEAEVRLKQLITDYLAQHPDALVEMLMDKMKEDGSK